MKNRPVLDKHLDSKTFYEFYYLKEELLAFCREYHLPTSGGKLEIRDRIAYYLSTGKILSTSSTKKKGIVPTNLDIDTKIESDFVCSQQHRAFFKNHIGSKFSFNVTFQKWLKSNAGKTYGDAIQAYSQLIEEKKKCKTTIDKQFEYNTYIRDFFADNQGKSLDDAIRCWKYKKQAQGHNQYEKADLIAIH